MIRQYRRKPALIQAVQWKGDLETADFIEDWSGRNTAMVAEPDGLKPRLKVHTLEGTIVASPGDYIIKGIKGEFYSCRPDIFEATYEDVTPAPFGGK